jgi:hydroxymethylpyrimidine/phosphomethylpyrimidine kinase
MNARSVPPPVALIIAGSDNSAGAGAQADLKTFTAYGVYGLTAITCVVAEAPGRVLAIQPVDLDVVRQQIELSFEAFPVAAMKTGMLHSREVIELAASTYERLARRIPLVVDPVMVASSGDPLLKPDAVAAYRERLFPLAALVTPNLDEARVLLGQPIDGAEALRAAGGELVARYGTAFLMKGGHLGGEEAVDFLCLPGGRSVEYRAPFTRGIATHGTGCTYSAAIAAGLARGFDLETAAARAKQYLTAAVRDFFRWQDVHGANIDALNHWSARPGAEPAEP